MLGDRRAADLRPAPRRPRPSPRHHARRRGRHAVRRLRRRHQGAHRPRRRRRRARLARGSPSPSLASVVAFYASARGMQDGEAVPVIAATSTAANVSCILGGIVVFGDPMPADTLGIVLQVLAFAMVVVGRAGHAAAGARRRAQRERLAQPSRAAHAARRRHALAAARLATRRRAPRWTHPRRRARSVVPIGVTASTNGRGGRMAAVEEPIDHARPAGAGAPAPVDALHAAWAPSTTARGADHRPRRGLPRLRRARQPLLRRARRAVLREHRPRPRRRRPGRRRPGQGARLLHQLVLRAPEVRSSSPRAIAELAPGDLNRVFFTSRRLGGGRVRAQALPPVPQAHGQPRALQGHLAQARLPRHDDGRAHRDRHPRRAARRSSRCSPAPRTCRTRTPYRPEVDDPAEAIRERIEFEGPETVSLRDPRARAELGRLLRAAARATSSACARSATSTASCFISDEVICSWGRLGEWFGAERFGYEPDLITTAKGLTSSYAPMGAVIASDRVFAPFADGTALVRARASPSAGTRSPPRSRWPTSTCSSTRASSSTCARNEGAFRRDARRRCATSRSSATCAAWATSGRSSWSRTATTKATFTEEECDWLLRDFLSRRAVPARADLPRRRPRRPGDPALAAADRRARSSSRRSRRCCGRRSRRRRRRLRPRAEPRAHRSATSSSDLDIRLVAGEEGAGPAASAGCTSPSSPTRRRGCRAASCC